MKRQIRNRIGVLFLILFVSFGLLPSHLQQVQAASKSMNIYGIFLDTTEKGDAVLLESNGEYLLMDLGVFPNMPAICDQLDALGVKYFDLYFSHLHMDHVGAARGDWIRGLNYLKERGFEINRLYLPDPSLAPESGNYATKYTLIQTFMDQHMGGQQQIVYLKKGDSFRVGNAVANVIGPDLNFVNSIHPSDYRNKVSDAEAETEAGQNTMDTYYENNCSLITRITCGSVSYLTTGDMLKDEADYLVKYYSPQLKSDILKLSHHGTATGNTADFLQAVDPVYSFASNSGKNSVNATTGRWDFYKSCNVAKAVSMAYFISNEQETIIYHVEGGKITPYQGSKIDEDNKLTGWTALYGADGTNRKKDYYYLDENGTPLTGIQLINGEYYNLGAGGCMEYGQYDANGTYLGWKNYSGGVERFYYAKPDSNLTPMATGLSKIGGDYYLFHADGRKEEGIGVFALKEVGDATYGVNADSTIVVGKDIEYEGSEYHFYNDGKMAEKEFVQKNGDTYYYGKYGKKIYSTLLTYAGKYYYLGSDGVVYRNKYLTTDEGDTYYFGADGTAITNKFKKRMNQVYYFGADGKMVLGKNVTVGENEYFLADDGVRVGRGFHERNGKQYFTDATGKLLKNTFVKSGGASYFVGKYGTKVTDHVVKAGEKQYYVDEEGRRVTRGLHESGKKTYFTNSKGQLVYNQIVTVDGNRYYIGKYGTVVKSKKIRIKGAAYYFGEDGVMYRDTTARIGSRIYHFDAKGVMRAASADETVRFVQTENNETA